MNWINWVDTGNQLLSLFVALNHLMVVKQFKFNWFWLLFNSEAAKPDSKFYKILVSRYLVVIYYILYVKVIYMNRTIIGSNFKLTCFPRSFHSIYFQLPCIFVFTRISAKSSSTHSRSTLDFSVSIAVWEWTFYCLSFLVHPEAQY